MKGTGEPRPARRCRSLVRAALLGICLMLWAGLPLAQASASVSGGRTAALAVGARGAKNLRGGGHAKPSWRRLGHRRSAAGRPSMHSRARLAHVSAAVGRHGLRSQPASDYFHRTLPTFRRRLPSSPATNAGAVTFSGFVQDQNGKAVGGGTLYLYDSSGGQFISAIGSDGSFSFSVAAGQYTLKLDLHGVAGFPNNVSLSTTIDLSASVTQNLTIPVLPLSATITDSGGNPVPNATVAQVGDCSNPSFDLFPGGTTSGYYDVASAITDSNGVAAVPLLPCSDSSMNFQVTPPSGSGLASTSFHITGPVSRASSAQWTLPQAVTFSGTVQDQNGKAVGAGTLYLYDSSGGQFISAIGSDGSFSFSVAAGQYTLKLDLHGVAGFPNNVSLSTTIDLSASVTQNLTIPVLPLSATITDSGGNPVPNATVAQVGDCSNPSFDLFPGGTTSGYYDVASAVTGSNGVAAVPLLPCSDSSLTFQVTPPSGSGLAGASFQVTGPVSQASSAQWTLYSVYGDLTDGSGDPLAQQQVSLTQSSSTTVSGRGPRGALPPASYSASVADVNLAARRSATSTPASTTTDAHGFYGITVPPATYTLTVSGQAPAGATLPTSYTVSTSGLNLINGRIQNLALPVTTLSATVLGLGGTPLAGASVQVPCATTSFSLFSGGQTSGSVCGAASTNAKGIANVALLPISSAGVIVTPPPGVHCDRTTLSGVDLIQSRSLTIMMTCGPASSSPNAVSTFGDNVTFTFSVGNGTSVGVVTFSDSVGGGSSTTLGTVAVTGGVATFSTSSLVAGTHTISATYSDPSSCPSVPGATCDGLQASYGPDSLTQIVQQALILVHAPQLISAYGFHLPTLTPSETFLNGSSAAADVTTAPTCVSSAPSVTAPAVSPPVGSYTTTCSGGSFNANYKPIYAYGSLVVKAAPLFVFTTTVTGTYGSPVTLAPTYRSFVNGDTASSLTTKATCTTSAPSNAVVGSYSTLCSGAADPNYVIGVVANGIYIKPAVLYITPDTQTVPYSDALPALTWHALSFVNGDTASSLTFQPTCFAAASQDSSGNVTARVGSYKTFCSGAYDPNYNIFYKPGVLSVQAEDTGIAYTGPTTITHNVATTVSATLTADGGTIPVVGRTIVFTLGNLKTCSGTTDSAGHASCLMPGANLTGSQTMQYYFVADGFYAGVSGSQSVTMQ
jgi:MBG domain (YGX type)/Bacterial Ig-like domain (group 3)